MRSKPSRSTNSRAAPTPRIRSLHKRDWPEWLRMRQALWPDCPPAMHGLEMGVLANRSRRHTVLVLDLGQRQLGGFAELSVRDRVDGSMSDRVGYLEGWYVDPRVRGQGWGRRLIMAPEQWTARQGFTELGSDAELHNPDSIAAHAALGFRETFRLVGFLKKVRKESRSDRTGHRIHNSSAQD